MKLIILSILSILIMGYNVSAINVDVCSLNQNDYGFGFVDFSNPDFSGNTRSNGDSILLGGWGIEPGKTAALYSNTQANYSTMSIGLIEGADRRAQYIWNGTENIMCFDWYGANNANNFNPAVAPGDNFRIVVDGSTFDVGTLGNQPCYPVTVGEWIETCLYWNETGQFAAYKFNDVTCTNTTTANNPFTAGGIARWEGGATNFIDNFRVWNYSREPNSFDSNCILVTTTEGIYINISEALPVTGTYESQTHIINLTANISGDFSTANFSLYLNSALNQTKEYDGDVNKLINFTVTFSEGVNNYYINGSVFNGDGIQNDSVITGTQQITIDMTSPQLSTNFVNSSIHYNNNLVYDFNFSDNVELHSINITIDNEIIFNTTNIQDFTYNYSLDYDPSSLDVGKHNLNIYYADGHTAMKLRYPNSWKPKTSLLKDSLKYDFNKPYKEGYIKIKQKGINILDSWKTKEEKDKYTFEFSPQSIKEKYTFEVTASSYIHIVESKEKKYKTWLIYDEHWIDFMPYTDVDINRISDNKVEVTVNGINNKIDKIQFNSVGDLNVVEINYTFYKVNISEVYTSPVFGGYDYDLNLSIDFGELELDISGINPTAILDWNGTNYTSTLVSFNENHANFTKTFEALEIDTTQQLVNHIWFFNLPNLTNGYLSTSTLSQNITPIIIDKCSANVSHVVANFTYYDEGTGDSLVIDSNAYQLKIFDSTYYFNQTDSFTNSNTDGLCTNLNPDNITYNWNMWGTFTLKRNNYVTRVIEIDESVPYLISNNPTNNISLFMVSVLNSSTMVYNWYTSQLQVIDGTMRIHKCNDDGTKSLVESTPIISGTATANIQLLTQPYSYDVIVDGVVYQDTDSYTRCHIESQTERTYYVEIQITDISDLLGLYGIDCYLNKTGNNSVTMIWGPNSEDPSYVQGCIKAYRATITNNTLIYENCTVESDGYRRSVTIPANSNTYTVQGYMLQNNNTRMCDGTISFIASDQAGGTFGLTALLAAFFLIAGLALLWAGEGAMSNIGAAIGLGVSWIIGIIIFPWAVVTGLIIFLLFVVFVGRYTRK